MTPSLVLAEHSWEPNTGASTGDGGSNDAKTQETNGADTRGKEEIRLCQPRSAYPNWSGIPINNVPIRSAKAWPSSVDT